jgi:hypothetical protein
MQFIDCTQDKGDKQGSVIDVSPEPNKPAKPGSEKIKRKKRFVPK